MADPNMLQHMRQNILLWRQSVDNPDISNGLLAHIDYQLRQILDNRHLYANARGWEGRWIIHEAEQLQRDIDHRSKDYGDEEVFLSTVNQANHLAVTCEASLNQMIEMEPPDDIIDISLFNFDQPIHLPWWGGREHTIPIEMHHCMPFDTAIAESLDTWYGYCRFPMPRNSPLPLTIFVAWFKRHHQPSDNDNLENVRFSVYLNLDHIWKRPSGTRMSPFNNYISAKRQAIWFYGPRLHVLSAKWYFELRDIVDNYRRLLPFADRLQQKLVDIDLLYRQQFHQWTPQDRAILEPHYRQMFANILRIRDRLRDNYQHFVDRLNMFSVDDETGGGGGLLIP